MSIEKVRDYFRKWNIEDRIQEFDVSSATVELAAKALNCEPERIAKSIALKAGDGAILVVAAGDARIDNAKFKAKFGFKAKMLSPDETITMVGHAVGGVCPFAVNEGVKTYLDISLKRFKTVFPACGSSNSAIELTIDELETCSCFEEWVDVCKDWE
ncbi:MAG: YbaK/EbsC family protein [Clostridiaceae bacterium]|nr:YbaK/EbsC family protein [Clostridiaceae bacterium]